jgi:hypothetical protein
MASYCKSCNAKIMWVRSKDGLNMPLDTPGKPRIVLDDKNVAHVVRTFISHFATCPNADQHRKKR